MKIVHPLIPNLFHSLFLVQPREPGEAFASKNQQTINPEEDKRGLQSAAQGKLACDNEQLLSIENLRFRKRPDFKLHHHQETMYNKYERSHDKQEGLRKIGIG